MNHLDDQEGSTVDGHKICILCSNFAGVFQVDPFRIGILYIRIRSVMPPSGPVPPPRPDKGIQCACHNEEKRGLECQSLQRSFQMP